MFFCQVESGEVPCFEGGPSARVIAQVGASIALCATGAGIGAAIALNVAFSTFDMATGKLDFKQALLQTGVSTLSTAVGGYGGQLINMGAGGINYQADGGINWSTDNLKSSVKKGGWTMALNFGMNQGFGAMGVKVDKSLWAQTLSSTVSTTFNSSLNGRGNFFDLSFDTDNWAQHVGAGLASGATTLAMAALNSGNSKDSNDAVMDGYTGKLASNTHDTGGMGWFNNPFANKAISSAINQSVMNLTYSITGGEGFSNNYVNQFNWNALTYSHTDVGSWLGSQVNLKINEKYNEDSAPKGPLERKPQQKGLLELWLGGWHESRKGSLSKTSKDEIIGEGVDESDVMGYVEYEDGDGERLRDDDMAAALAAGESDPSIVQSDAITQAKGILDNFWTDTKGETNGKLAELRKTNPELAAKVEQEVLRLRKVDQQIKAQKAANIAQKEQIKKEYGSEANYYYTQNANKVKDGYYDNQIENANMRTDALNWSFGNVGEDYNAADNAVNGFTDTFNSDEMYSDAEIAQANRQMHNARLNRDMLNIGKEHGFSNLGVLKMIVHAVENDDGGTSDHNYMQFMRGFGGSFKSTWDGIKTLGRLANPLDTELNEALYTKMWTFGINETIRHQQMGDLAYMKDAAIRYDQWYGQTVNNIASSIVNDSFRFVGAVGGELVQEGVTFGVGKGVTALTTGTKVATGMGIFTKAEKALDKAEDLNSFIKNSEKLVFSHMDDGIQTAKGASKLDYVATGSKADLGYDISKWSEYGMPSDGYFSKMIPDDMAEFIKAGKNIDLAGYNGAGFVSSAEELYTVTKSSAMKKAMAVPYSPDYLLEFQLKNTKGLQNVLQYGDDFFRPGGKTLNGFSEFNVPGLNSSDIINWRLRKLIK